VAAHAADGGGAGGAGSDPGSFAGQWLAAYTDYLKRAAGQSAETIDLYQKVTDRVVSGELAPTATQDLLSSFVQSRGSVYADELARLNMRFFGEMVRIGSAYAHELGRAIVPDAPPPPQPPTFDPADPAGWFHALRDYSEDLSASIAGGYQALVDRAAAGEVGASQVQDAAAGYLQHRLPQYLGELGSLWFELLNALTDLRVRSEREFLSGVLERTDGDNGDGAFELTLTAPLGGTATATVSISNTRGEAARIRCDLTDVRREDGVGPAFVPTMTVEPEDIELAPGDEATFVVTAQLVEGEYEPGVVYVGSLRITGHGDPRLEVPLRITATEAATMPEQ